MSQIAIAMFGDIGHREIVGEKEIDEAAKSEPDEGAHRKSGVARGFDQKRTPRDDCGDSASDGINREGESQQ